MWFATQVLNELILPFRKTTHLAAFPSSTLISSVAAAKSFTMCTFLKPSGVLRAEVNRGKMVEKWTKRIQKWWKNAEKMDLKGFK